MRTNHSIATGRKNDLITKVRDSCRACYISSEANFEFLVMWSKQAALCLMQVSNSVLSRRRMVTTWHGLALVFRQNVLRRWSRSHSACYTFGCEYHYWWKRLTQKEQHPTAWLNVGYRYIYALLCWNTKSRWQFGNMNSAGQVRDHGS